MKRFLNCLFLLMLISVFSGVLNPVETAWASQNINNQLVNATVGDGGITISGHNFPSMTDTNKDFAAIMNEPLNKYKTIATVVTGFGTVTAFLAMIFCFTKLSAAGDNEVNRKRAIAGILTSGVGIALLGSATIIIGFFWNLFKTT